MPLGKLFQKALAPFQKLAGQPGAELKPWAFWHERLQLAFEQRGFDPRNVRGVLKGRAIGMLGTTELSEAESILRVRPLDARMKLEILPEFTETPEFHQLAIVFRRVRNIARELPLSHFESAEKPDPDLSRILREPAEVALLEELARRQPVIEQALAAEDYRRAFGEASHFGPSVDRFFTEVFVMVDDAVLRTGRLRLMRRLEELILKLADVSEIVPEAET